MFAPKKTLPLAVSLIVFVVAFFCFQTFILKDSSETQLGFSEIRNFVNSKYRGRLYFSSFFNSFHNLSAISEQENLYHESSLGALMFAPDYKYQDCLADNSYEQYFSNFYLNKFPVTNADYYDKRCFGDTCLEQKYLSLFLDGEPLTLPSELTNIKALSIGLVKSGDALADSGEGFFLLGATIYQDDSYQGLVYILKNSKFEQILTKTEIISPYFGRFGFGGEPDDFLVIYGAEQGLAYRLQSGTQEIEDLSHFFDFRLMDRGFKAEVIKLEQDNRANFYLFSLTENKPKFIKLWENQAGLGISGGTVLRAPALNKNNQTQILFLQKLTTKYLNHDLSLLVSDTERCQIFYDYGFKNETEAFFISKQHPDEGTSLSRIRQIADLHLKLDLASSFLETEKSPLLFFRPISSSTETISENSLANDLRNLLWQEVKSPDAQELIDITFESFVIKVVFPTQIDKFYSPFLQDLTLNYYYSQE